MSDDGTKKWEERSKQRSVSCRLAPDENPEKHEAEAGAGQYFSAWRGNRSLGFRAPWWVINESWEKKIRSRRRSSPEEFVTWHGDLLHRNFAEPTLALRFLETTQRAAPGSQEQSRICTRPFSNLSLAAESSSLWNEILRKRKSFWKGEALPCCWFILKLVLGVECHVTLSKMKWQGKLWK